MGKSGKQQNHRAFRIKFLKESAFFVIVLGSLLCGSCGIEDYPYLEPVEESNITRVMNTRAAILLPNVISVQFSHFAIYYRIYISDVSIVSNILPADMNKINTSLSQDYNAFLSYTSSGSSSGASASTQIATIFLNRKYYPLNAGSINIDDLLSDSAKGRSIVIDFDQTNGQAPTIQLDGRTEYELFRTSGAGISGSSSFDIKPEGSRVFINTPELNSSQNAASANVNNDVADKTVFGDRSTYVSMYIVSTGRDNITFSPFYSQPTFIGVFRLPDP
jgi:hypothetical protein